MSSIKDVASMSTIVKLIKESQYVDAIQILTAQSQKHPKSRAALSLLGYCYYHINNFSGSAECYKQLTQLYPEVEDYKVYYALSLYKAGAYPEATMALSALYSSSHTKMLRLQACIKYCEEDYSAAKLLLEKLPQDDPNYIYNMGCLLYQEGKYEEACVKFTSGVKLMGYIPALSYNIALCYYSLKMYPQALKQIEYIKNQGFKEHLQLSIEMISEDDDFHSMGNTPEHHQTVLIKALNLKAAIEYQRQNLKMAQEALTHLSPRFEQELDPVTLHNQALLNMDTKPSDGFKKLASLLQQPFFPHVTFANLLLLYCKYEYVYLAADVLAENAHLTHKIFTPYIYELLDALLMSQKTPEETFRKFDDMCGKLSEQVRKMAKKVRRQARNKEAKMKTVQECKEILEKYTVVMMAQAKIYWNRENYDMVQKIFHKSWEIWCEDDTLKLNIAHVLFMQNKYKKAISFYEPIVVKHSDNILNVSAVVLANLCFSYVMTCSNTQAEELMKEIEKKEKQISKDDPNKMVFHHCIVNLVIGMLYCTKGNYEFGISRVIKNLEPYDKKLGTDTWFYAKQCFLSLLENIAKHMVMPVDSVIKECIHFLEQCMRFGKTVPAHIQHPLEERCIQISKNTVAYEACKLLTLFYEVTCWK
ncbi:tetratricopeptide repeat protein 30A-like [Takifugu flavidus]|nr:tetratricopeptide repeat protein 30A-like [Takifugu flavidus]